VYSGGIVTVEQFTVMSAPPSPIMTTIPVSVIPGEECPHRASRTDTMTALRHEVRGTLKKVPEFCHVCLGMDDLYEETPGPTTLRCFFVLRKREGQRFVIQGENVL